MAIRRISPVKILVLALLAVAIVVGSAAALSYRTERSLRERAREQGIEVESASVERRLFATTLRDAKLRFAKAPGLTVDVKALTVHSRPLRPPEVELGDVHIASTGEPNVAYESLRLARSWEGVPVSFRRVDVEYTHRFAGRVRLQNVTSRPATTGAAASAEVVELGGARLQKAEVSVQQHERMLEVTLRDAALALEVRYFPPTTRSALWMLSIRNQALLPLASLLNWQLAPALQGTLVGGSVSFHVPTDPAAGVRGQLQLVFDNWPKPDWPEVEALLGNVAAFAAVLEPRPGGAGWDVTRVRTNLLLFALEGGGHLQLGKQSSLVLDLEGARTCAQLRAHLAASEHLRQIDAYVAAAQTAAKASPGKDVLAEQAHLRLQLVLDSHTRRAVWGLEAGCGLPARASGTFSDLGVQSPPSDSPAEHAH